MTVEDLEATWQQAAPAPRGRGSVRLICLRLGDGVHECPERAEVRVDDGLVGDRWSAAESPDPDAQITLMNVRVVELLAAGRLPLDTPGDNFLVDLDLSEEALPAGTRLRLGSAVVELTAQPHTGCKTFSERFGLEALKWVNAHRNLRLRGANCRVVEAGWVAVGDRVEVGRAV